MLNAAKGATLLFLLQNQKHYWSSGNFSDKVITNLISERSMRIRLTRKEWWNIFLQKTPYWSKVLWEQLSGSRRNWQIVNAGLRLSTKFLHTDAYLSLLLFRISLCLSLKQTSRKHISSLSRPLYKIESTVFHHESWWEQRYSFFFFHNCWDIVN